MVLNFGWKEENKCANLNSIVVFIVFIFVKWLCLISSFFKINSVPVKNWI